MRRIRIRAEWLRLSLRSTLGLLLLPAAIAACAAGRSEGLDVATLPVEVRADYELFADRCSRCHSLARPLESGIKDDTFWKEYVDRMRRQPGSGISPADEIPILRFLHYYSLDKKGPEVRTEDKR
jgi:hypothetical protein